jgi:hypothetical protein
MGISPYRGLGQFFSTPEAGVQVSQGRCCVDGMWRGEFAWGCDQMARASSVKAVESCCFGWASTPSS